ncbi:putative mannosyl-oligosaccharide glucosidase [Erysiphe neolycopersici]|uniref:Mannosyl-oligosaccharide glucosidase n=1 Tax=Erysiphe neolycopersici TaxID=212602 RepID=A0A420HUC2_9PEZI|nr:putative mannosyl-oligosaccharide glucosidase [Erysiphe neolycopersici]
MLIFPLIVALACVTLVQATQDDSGTKEKLTQALLSVNNTYLWGSYRPNLYFGIKPRIPESFLGGLMWARVEDFASVQDRFRHTCEQSDEIRGYGWDEFDARKGGVQNIYDEGNGIDISTKFVKIPGGSNGDDWVVRIQGTLRKESPADMKSTVVFYAALEGEGSLAVDNQLDPLGFEGDVTIVGESPGLNRFKMTVSSGNGQHPQINHEAAKLKPLDRTFVSSIMASKEMIWQSKTLIFKEIREQIDTYLKEYSEINPPPPAQMFTVPQKSGVGNVHFIQKVFQGNFEFDIIYESGSTGEKYDYVKVTELIEKNSKLYWQRFAARFELQPPFNTDQLRKCASSLFSNLLGGLGYFYGDSLVDRSYASEYEERNEGFWKETADARAQKLEKLEGPSELLTTVPSRPFFPRGFLWDEGFHLIPIIDWDLDLTLEIVRSWFNLMDEDGWIGREQILGAEARSKVPIEFQVQYPHYANPPTLFIIIEIFVAKLEALSTSSEVNGAKRSNLEEESVYLRDPELAFQYLRELYPKLKKHYNWYRKTQAGDLHSYDRIAFSSQEAYRWKGRSEQHVLTSGLDDYPRPQPPHPGELHVDLISWIGLMSKSLQKTASLLGHKDDVSVFEATVTAIRHNLDNLHWSNDQKCYCDASIDEYEEHKLVCHKGYISIFPFLTGLIEPTSDKLGHILDLLSDPDELWSKFGIRSLSKKSEFYGTAENYWRGSIWLNINYLVVSQLLRYAQTAGPEQQRAKEIYGQLRINLVKTVYESWQETGFAWEQYNADTGKGQRTKHFTGWTSLTMKIMGMPDLMGISLDTAEIVEQEHHDEL